MKPATSGTKRLRYVLSNQGGCEGPPWAAALKVDKIRGTHFQVKLNSQVELNATKAVSGNAEGDWYAWFVNGGYATKLHGIEFEAVSNHCDGACRGIG
jgi:hypothetical protein